MKKIITNHVFLVAAAALLQLVFTPDHINLVISIDQTPELAIGLFTVVLSGLVALFNVTNLKTLSLSKIIKFNLSIVFVVAISLFFVFRSLSRVSASEDLILGNFISSYIIMFICIALYIAGCIMSNLKYVNEKNAKQ